MNKQTAVGLVIGLIIIIGLAIVFVSVGTDSANQVQNTDQVQNEAAGINDTQSEQAAESNATTSEQASLKTFTMADVAANSTTASCYSVINGSVYDLTSWIGKHPGGQQAIMKLCGKDGSSIFNNQHGGMAQPESALATFKIGIIAQ